MRHKRPREKEIYSTKKKILCDEDEEAEATLRESKKRLSARALPKASSITPTSDLDSFLCSCGIFFNRL